MRTSNWSLVLYLAAAVPTFGFWEAKDQGWISKHGQPEKSWSNEGWRRNSRGSNEWKGWSSSSSGGIAATSISVAKHYVVPVPMSISSHKPSAGHRSSFSAMPYWKNTTQSQSAPGYQVGSMTTSTHYSTEVIIVTVCPSNFKYCPVSAKTTSELTKTHTHTTVIPISMSSESTASASQASPFLDSTVAPSVATSSVYRVQTITVSTLGTTSDYTTMSASPTVMAVLPGPEALSSSTAAGLSSEVTVSSVDGQINSIPTAAPTVITSSLLSTDFVEVTVCPSAAPSCPAMSQITQVTTSIVAYTTVVTVYPVAAPSGPADASASAGSSSTSAVPVYLALSESQAPGSGLAPAGSSSTIAEPSLFSGPLNAGPTLSSVASLVVSSTAAAVPSGAYPTMETAIVYSSITQISTVFITTYSITATYTAGGITSQSILASLSTITSVGPSTIYVTSTLTKVCTEEACVPATSGAPTTTVTLTTVYPSTSSIGTSNGDGVSVITTSEPAIITKTITLTASYLYNALSSSQSVVTAILTTSAVVSYHNGTFSAESSTPAGIVSEATYVSLVSSARWSAHLYSSHVRGKSTSPTAYRASPYSSHAYGNMTSHVRGNSPSPTAYRASPYSSHAYGNMTSPNVAPTTSSFTGSVSSSIPGWANLTSLTMNVTISNPITTSQAPFSYTTGGLYTNNTSVISSSGSVPSTMNITTSSPITTTQAPLIHSSTRGLYTNATSPTPNSNSTTLAKNNTMIRPITETWVPIMPSSKSNFYTNATSTRSSSTSKISSVTSTISSSSSTSSCAPTTSPTFSPACQSFDIPNCIPCEGQPGSDPATWCGLTTATDYYQEWPKTCKKISCSLEVTNTTVAPDGISRLGMIYNNQFPGPTIEANWGDEVEVHLTNQLTANGTSMHFHGVRQLWTNEMDGVPSITQCPLSGNGDQMTYRWVASQYGSSWYHSHYSLQAWEGAVGPMFIHGPSTAEYDIDLGPVMIQDWLHTPVFELFENDEKTGSPIQDNGLINGQNIYVDPTTNAITGARSKFVFEKGKKHYMRLVNMALDSSFAFSIDKHLIQVVATDFVPIIPYTTDVLKIAVGQRYDIIVEANQDVDDYWLRIDPLTFSAAPGRLPPCGSYNTMDGDIKAIISYNGSCSTPTTTAWAHDNVCTDEPYASLTPYLPKNVGVVDTEVTESLVIVGNRNTSIYRWYLSGTTFLVEFNQPTLLDIYQNITDYAGPLAIELPAADQWVYIIIESPIPLPHPIHLHGHDFHILGSGPGVYANQTLNMKNPPRRDVASLPSGGYLVLAFLTDNPGAWLMHCHIGWHVSMG